MISYKQKIQALKADTLAVAFANHIPVNDLDGRPLGKLVPIGAWIEDESEKINQICGWRNSAKKMFPTQTLATPDSTLTYIQRNSIASDAGILFCIFDQQDRFVGHIGLTDARADQFELAHLIKGVNDTDPKLIFSSEVCLLNWGFQTLGCERACVEIMSYNWIVSMLHSQVGFEISACHPLRKIESEAGVSHEIVGSDEANVKYTITRLSVNKARFYESVERLIKDQATKEE